MSTQAISAVMDPVQYFHTVGKKLDYSEELIQKIAGIATRQNIIEDLLNLPLSCQLCTL